VVGLVWSTRLVRWGPKKSSEKPLEAGRRALEAGPRLDMSGQLDKSDITIGQV
jgi:hypothetical protein